MLYCRLLYSTLLCSTPRLLDLRPDPLRRLVRDMIRIIMFIIRSSSSSSSNSSSSSRILFGAVSEMRAISTSSTSYLHCCLVYVCMYIYIYTHIHTLIYTHTYKYTYIHIYIYIERERYTHTHMYMYSLCVCLFGSCLLYIPGIGVREFVCYFVCCVSTSFLHCSSFFTTGKIAE